MVLRRLEGRQSWMRPATALCSALLLDAALEAQHPRLARPTQHAAGLVGEGTGSLPEDPDLFPEALKKQNLQYCDATVPSKQRNIVQGSSKGSSGQASGMAWQVGHVMKNK